MYPNSSTTKFVLPVLACELAASFNINKQLKTMKTLKVEQIFIFDICAVMAKVYVEKLISKVEMQLSIVLSRIEAEETNGSEGRLQTGGGGGRGGGGGGDDER